MKNFTLMQCRKIALVIFPVFLLTIFTVCANAQVVYTTIFTDWSESYNANAGSYQATGGPAIYSFGTDASKGQVMSRVLTNNGTTGSGQQALMTGQKLVIRLTSPVGGGRTGIQNGGRIGFSLRNTNDLFDPAEPVSAFDRYNSNTLLRVEFEGGQSNAQLIDGNGILQTGMPGFTDFVNGQTYEIEMISDKEFNLQVVGGSRYNIKPLIATGAVKQITIANLGENRDAVYTNIEVVNMPSVTLLANTAESYTVAGVMTDILSTPNTVTKSGAGNVTLTGQNTYTGLTTVDNGTLTLQAAAANTIIAGNDITVLSGGTLKVSQDQVLHNLDIQAGSFLVVDAGNTLSISGTVTGEGTIINNGSISMSGTLSQVFPNAAIVAVMNNLVINNNSVTGVTLNSNNITVTGTLSFLANSGIRSLLTTGANNIHVNTISGASLANGWVNGNLLKNILSPGVTVFEVGDALNYAPSSLNVSATSFAAGDILVSTRTPLSSNLGNATLSLNSLQSLNRVWSVTKPLGSTFAGSYTGSFTYVAGDLLGSPDVANLRTGIYNGTMWYYPGTVSTGSLQVTTPAAVIPMLTNDIVFALSSPVTISGVLVTPKIYDGEAVADLDFSVATVSGVMNGNFVSINSASATGTYNDRHVGTGKAVTITGAALSGADAGAYELISQPSSSGNITARPLEITAATNTKLYDGTTSAAAIPTMTSGTLQNSDIANFTESYNTINAGTGKILTPAGTVNDGNNGNDYTYSFVTNNTGVINSIPITNLTAIPGTIGCTGTTTTITVSASGGDGELQYCLTGTATHNYQLSTVFTGVTAGTYTLTVRDADFFTKQLTGIIVGQSTPVTATVVKTDISVCGSANDGSITITPSGGTGSYTYSWTGSNGFTAGDTSTLTGLPIGFYNVLITDANACSTTISEIHIGYAFAVYVTNSGSISSSCTNTGSIILYGNAGVHPYSYSLDGNTYQPDSIFINLAAGNYTGYVKDAAGCVSTKPITVEAAAPITVTVYSTAGSSCINSGSIELFHTGGIPPYSYSLDNITYQTSNRFDNLATGTYTGYVKDSKDCIGSVNPVTISQLAAVTVTSRFSNTSTCINDGTIQLIGSGGVAPYSYSLDNVTYLSTNTFTGLAAGVYTGWAKDTKGCTGSVSITVGQNPIVVTASAKNAGSCSMNNGSVQLFRTGGTGPYTYSMDGIVYQAGTIFTNLFPGTYSAYIKDSRGCVGMLAGIVVGPACLPPGIAINKNNYSGAYKVEGNTNPHIQAFPNPSSAAFTLQLQGFSNDKVSVSITDQLGRKVYLAQGTASQLYRFGTDFKAGIYFVIVQQGASRQSLKLIKE